MTLAKPHIVLIIARGEAVRNFLYSDVLQVLSENARVTLLSVITDKEFVQRFGDRVDQIIELKEYPESKLVRYLREIIDFAHYRWIWTEKVKNKWETLDSEAVTFSEIVKHAIWKTFIYLFANRFALNFLSLLENQFNLLLKPTSDFDELFSRIKPDLVFNCSHIHAPRGELPVRIAHKMGIPTAAFIFSWDNLSSRGRILPPYDHYLVWHQGMYNQLRSLYPYIKPEQVTITGTPQFDYHFKPEFWLSKEQLCRQIGADPYCPLILYTTGKDNDFPEEHLYIQAVVRILQDLNLFPMPKLIVRTYIKGTSAEMKALAKSGLPNVIFPPVLWEEKWFTPQYEDLAIYTGLLRHAVMGINAASTVSLELMMHDKPVVNLGFDPPGSHIPYHYRWARHIEFDHYRPVAASGGVMVARSLQNLRDMIEQGLANPASGHEARQHFTHAMFGETLDGKSGQRVAETLLRLAEINTSCREH